MSGVAIGVSTLLYALPSFDCFTSWRSTIHTGGKAELHTHTTFSDGVLTPEELVSEARDAGLEALAVTDHDIVGAVAPALIASADMALEVIPGIEFSTNIDGHEVHMLGLFIDHEDPQLLDATRRSRQFRHQRAGEIVGRLRDLDIDIEFATVEAACGGGSIGRPHIARALVEHGVTQTLDEGFRRFLGIGRPAFVPKPTLEAAEVIDVLHRAGGVAILAHPASSRVNHEDIAGLAAIGLDGFEVYHPKHNGSARRRLQALIDELGLLPSGGSDFHGPGSGRTKLGEHAVSMNWMEALRDAASTHRNE